MPSVILTRPIQRVAGDNTFSISLRNEGIDVVELPMIQVHFPEDQSKLESEIRKLALGEFNYCVLSSPTAIEFFHQKVLELELYDSIKTAVGFATVGDKSGAKLEEFGYDLAIPLPHQLSGAAALLTQLRTFDISEKRVVIFQSQIGLPVLTRAFEMCGATVTHEILYETTGPTLHDAALLINLLEADDATHPEVITFFSPSSVEFFVKTLTQMGLPLRKNLPVLAAIGETTAFEIEMRLRRKPEIIAQKANQESLAEDIISYIKHIS